MLLINRWICTYFAIAALLFQIVFQTAVQAEPLSVTKIADGLYVHQGVHEDLSEGYHGDICNISFVVGSKGVAVIDTGGSFNTGKALHEAIRKITPLPILYVINTHVHPDHIFGNAAFLEDKFPGDKPVFVGHTKLADAMTLRADAYMRMNQAWMGDAFAGSEIVKPTLAVQDSLTQNSLTLDIGDRKLILTAYPTAHTNTDISVFDSKTATLLTGDLLFIERTPSVDGDIKGWLAVINQLKQLKLNMVVPGHGTPTKDAQAAFIKEQHYLETLLTDIRASIKKGEVMEKTMDTAAASEKNNWVLFDIVNRRNVNNLYPVLEWE